MKTNCIASQYLWTMLTKLVSMCLLGLSVFYSPILRSQNVVINEVMTDNESYDIDGEESYADWVEIFNNGPLELDLEGYSLTDGAESFVFPELILPSGGYLILYMTEEDDDSEQLLYCDLRLSRMGCHLYLRDNEDQLIDQVKVPTLADDRVYGRVVNGESDFGLISTPTPGANNAIEGIAVSHASGFYSSSFDLELISGSDLITIRYTLDGSVPDLESMVYAAPISIEQNSDQDYSISSIVTTPPDNLWNTPEYVFRADVIRAAAFSATERISPVITQTYFIDENMDERYSFPLVSIVTDSIHLFSHETGIYVPGITYENSVSGPEPRGNYDMRGFEWERPAHISFIEPEGDVGFETEAGIRIKGGWSPRFPQKSFNVYFRSEYGIKDIDYPIFSNKDEKSHKRIVLRNSGSDFFSTRFRDLMCQDSYISHGMEYQAYRPALVFINGEYWGIKNIREKYDEHYLERQFGDDADEYVIVEWCGIPDHGDPAEFNELMDYVDEHDLSDSSHYAYVADRLDIDNFIDYNIAEIYYANRDWPCNNHRYWKHSSDSAKWRVMIFDLDQTFGGAAAFDRPSMEHATTVGSFPFCECSSRFLRNLLEHDGFKNRFINRFYCQMDSTYSPDRLLDLVDFFEDLYAPEIAEHAARWGYPWNLEMWQGEVDMARVFASNRRSYMYQHLDEYFELENFNFDCAPKKIELSGDIRLYPNPASTYLNLVNGTDDAFDARVEIYDIKGRMVKQFEATRVVRGGLHVLSLEDLNRGSYVVRVSGPGVSQASPLIIVGP